eukprot:g4201.t1
MTSMLVTFISCCLLSFFTVDADKASLSWGKEPMIMSSTGPDSTLPNFFFQAGAEEGGQIFAGYGFEGGSGEPRPFEIPILNCPADVYNNTSPDLRVPQLPWQLQDDWGCERDPKGEADVVVLENKYFRAAITPQWGGKVWSLYHKKYNRQLFFNNPAHQPANIGYRKAWSSGGAEWNWSPGKIGHSVFTESPVFSAQFETEKGPLVRVWEYDRQNHSIWSVDMLLDDEDDVFWAHPRIVNTLDHDIDGYWWTCVAMRINSTSRVVVPAKESITPCAAWPNGAWTQQNTSFKGPNLGGCDKNDGGRGTCAWQQDMSYLGNIPRAHDFFFRIYKPQTPYIALVEDDGFTILHSHPLNGTKFFTWGWREEGTWNQDFLSASDYQNPKCTKPYYDPNCDAYEHQGRYTELQIGPAPSQMHVFPMKKKSVFQWTEWFKAFHPANPEKMHSPLYDDALNEVSDWWSSNKGMTDAKIKEMDAFFEKWSTVAPKRSDMLTYGLPWGALREKLTGEALNGPTPFPTPSSNTNNDSSTPETRPWIELLETGTFSNETLKSVPLNFEIDPLWVQVLEKSISDGHETWLHRLYLGTVSLERGNIDDAFKQFLRSIQLQPSVHATRNLAIFAKTKDEAYMYYLSAWGRWKDMTTADDLIPHRKGEDLTPVQRLGKDLGAEIVGWLFSNKYWTALREVLADIEAYSFIKSKDLVLHGKAVLAMEDGDFETAQKILSSNCFPTYGSERPKLINLWFQSKVAEEENRLARNLTKMEMIMFRRRYGCDGDDATRTVSSDCYRGAPNLGYPYG